VTVDVGVNAGNGVSASVGAGLFFLQIQWLWMLDMFLQQREELKNKE
jgi:hypothetical protein